MRPSIGAKPTLWKPSRDKIIERASQAEFAGVTVTRAETCMRRCRASRGARRRMITSKLPLPLR